MQSWFKKQSRREFFGRTAGLAAGSGSVFSSMVNLSLVESLAAEGSSENDDYKALVCVFLEGGNDSFNMLSPVSGDPRLAYEETRGSFAIPVEGLTSIPALSDGHELGLVSSMPELHAFYTEGKAALVANVGTLREPTTIEGINDLSANLPLGLFSHVDQQQQWQSGLPDTREPGSGWGGRMADILRDLNGESGVPMSVSLAGNNMFQSGKNTNIFGLRPGSLPGIEDWNEPFFAGRRAGIENIMNTEYENVFSRAYAEIQRQVLNSNEELSTAITTAPVLNTVFSSDESALSGQLEQVAKIISSRNLLGKKRQTFFVLERGYDAHNSSLTGHAVQLGRVSRAVAEFQAAMVELGLTDKVTLFSASDFGRTLAPNGTGTDHGWGGNQFVIGGKVNGGQVYGQYPDLALGNPLDTGRGRFIPTTSVDEFFADLVLWMGVSPTDLKVDVLPYLSRFTDVIKDGPPLGLMNMV